MPEGGDQTARVNGEKAKRVFHTQLGQVLSLPEERQRVDDNLGAEIRLDPSRAGSQGPGPELSEGVTPAIGELDVVPGLTAATVAHYQVGIELPGQVIDGGPFALVPETQSHSDDGPLHSHSSRRKR